LIVSRRTDKRFACQKDSFLDLRLVEPFNRAFSEAVIYSPSRPTPTREMFSFIKAVRQVGKTGLRITIPGKGKEEATGHDVARYNVARTI
jgi:hypothetical protein